MMHASICKYENILPATLIKRLISTEFLILYIDIMPVITFFIPGGAWEETTLIIGPMVLLIGHLVAIINFLTIRHSCLLDNESNRKDAAKISPFFRVL
jgi:hypothetical protein